MQRLPLIVAALLLLPLMVLRADEPSKPVKVFVLAGQSNMEGKARNSLLDFQGKDAKTRDLFQHLRQDGKWIVRDDVFIRFLERKGPLTFGFCSPGDWSNRKHGMKEIDIAESHSTM